MPFSHDIEPITDDDDAIAEALLHAEPNALMPALAYITGDRSLLDPAYAIDPALRLVPGYEPSEVETRAAREAALAALRAFRDGGSRPAPPPEPDALLEMLEFTVGGAPMGEYVPLFREELGLDGADLRAPDWRLPELAPGTTFEVAVIGAGMSGLVVGHRLRQAGVPFVILEKNDDVGGTWLENTYPGCRVDVPNHFYSYSFAQRDDWPQYFSSQDVLLDYFRTCADDFGLRPDVRFGTEVTSMVWDDERQRWTLELVGPDGESTIEADAVVSAVGQLNRPSFPDIEGIDAFAGPSFHSARWRHDVELTGRRVGVIGTGASAAQFIPAIAGDVAELVVFQRTPPWLAPSPTYYQDVPSEVAWLFRHIPTYAQWYRFFLFWQNAEAVLPLIEVDEAWEPKDESVSAGNEMLRQFLADYIRTQFAERPDLVEAAMPHYPPAAKRLVRDDGTWARALTRDNVRVVTDHIERITETGVRTADGETHEVDVLIYGTGFQASDFLTPMKVVGRDGRELHETWHGDARAYLGVTVPHFPNLFLMYGPNTNIVINGSIIFFSECEANYIVECVRMLVASGNRSLDCRPEVHDAFNAEVDAGNRRMAWGVATVPSWYRNASGRSAQNWPFSLLEFWRRTREPNPADYELR